jgi:putative transposase
MNRLKYGDELRRSVETYQHSRSRIFLIQYQLVWCPKGRKPVLVGKVKERLEQIIRQVADELGI